MALTSVEIHHGAKSRQVMPLMEKASFGFISLCLRDFEMLLGLSLDTELWSNHIFQKVFYGPTALDTDKGKAFFTLWNNYFFHSQEAYITLNY